MENENPSAVPPEVSDLQEQCSWLRKQVLTILVLGIVISGTLNVFLLNQWRNANRDGKVLKEQVSPVFAEYQKVLIPQIEEVKRRIQEYGQKHPDFQPIMAKYQLPLTGAPPAAVSAPK